MGITKCGKLTVVQHERAVKETSEVFQHWLFITVVSNPAGTSGSRAILQAYKLRSQFTYMLNRPKRETPQVWVQAY